MCLMRIFAASVIGRLVVFSIMLPTAVLAYDIKENYSHQNKNENIIKISQTGIELAENENQERAELTQAVFDFRTIKEQEIEDHNEKRLAYYSSRLENYNPPSGGVEILVTGYSSTPDQTWGDPFTTASGTTVHIGTMACPAQYPFGTKIAIEGRGTYVCEDRGGAIKGSHFDMWFESRIEALQWGKRVVTAEIVK
jgi:3D (Asp-Asp-Asp) domain-containing protein